mgnify:CR=1 FL=1
MRHDGFTCARGLALALISVLMMLSASAQQSPYRFNMPPGWTRSAEGADTGWRLTGIGPHGPTMDFTLRWEPGSWPRSEARLAEVVGLQQVEQAQVGLI